MLFVCVWLYPCVISVSLTIPYLFHMADSTPVLFVCVCLTLPTCCLCVSHSTDMLFVCVSLYRHVVCVCLTLPTCCLCVSHSTDMLFVCVSLYRHVICVCLTLPTCCLCVSLYRHVVSVCLMPADSVLRSAHLSLICKPKTAVFNQPAGTARGARERARREGGERGSK